MSNYASLERYIPLVEFMGKICGKNYEIILHDVSTPERSVIAACNEHPGRQAFRFFHLFH